MKESVETKNRLFFDRHFYLYAKGWYERTDVLQDLKKIVADRCGRGIEAIGFGSIFSILIKLVYSHIGNEYRFIEFVENLLPEQRWKVKTSFNKESTFEEIMLNNCLSVLSRQKVTDIPFALGEPDWDILPKPASKKIKEMTLK